MSLALHPYRATVIADFSTEWKLIEIPQRYGTDPVGPVKSAVDAKVGERVIVMDLSGSHAPEWLITQYESMIGRGADSPTAAHTHTIGQVDGLTDALAAKVDDTELTAYETAATAATKYAPIGHSHAWTAITDKPLTFPPSAHTHLWADLTDKPTTFTPSAHTHLWADLTDKPATFAPSAHSHAQTDVTGLSDALAGKASQTEYAATKADVDGATYLVAADALVRRYSNGHFRVPDNPGTLDAAQAGWVDTNYVTKTSYNSGMAAKADAPGAWQNLTLGAGVTVDTGQSGPSPRARMTPLGLQIQGRRLRGPSTAPARDQVFATVPASLVPPYDILFSVDVQRAGSGNPGAHLTMKLKTGTGDIQWVTNPTTSTTDMASTGGAPSDYITLNNILLVW